MEIHSVPDSGNHGFKFDNSYLTLPGVFYKKQQPAAVKHPQIVLFNDALAQSLGLNAAALKKHVLIVECQKRKGSLGCLFYCKWVLT